MPASLHREATRQFTGSCGTLLPHSLNRRTGRPTELGRFSLRLFVGVPVDGLGTFHEFGDPELKRTAETSRSLARPERFSLSNFVAIAFTATPRK